MKFFIEGRRDGYSPEQCGKTMTVGELRAYLENFDEDAKIYLENDGGYTYGYITKGSFREAEDEDEDEEDYEDDPEDEDEDTDAEDDYETMEPEEFLRKHIDDYREGAQMASIRQAAQDVLDEAKEEIAWIALWRDCRRWMTIPFWPEGVNDTEPTFNAEDKKMLREILKVDANAIIVNAYYHNLGPAEMTRDSLANALRWQYENQTSRIAGHLQEDAAWKSFTR